MRDDRRNNEKKNYIKDRGFIYIYNLTPGC